MAARVKADAQSNTVKYRYQVRNWPEYDRALVNRGSLTVWFDEESIAKSWTPPRPKGRGRPGSYSDLAIQTCLTIKTLFRLPYRATEGLMKSLMKLNGLDLLVPDHTHMSRRVASLTVAIPRRPRKGSIHVVVDSTGLKIFGEGEWKVRQHGVGKRRTWRKVHLAVDKSARDIIGIEVTTAEWGDAEVFAPLLDQVEAQVSQVSGDGAYDTVDTPMPPLPSAAPKPPFRRVKAPCRGATSIRATPSSTRLPPRVEQTGRRTAATTGAASPRT